MDGLSEEERAVRDALYWYHDGTRKHSAEAYASCTTRRPTRELLKALLDRHNEDNGLLGVCFFTLVFLGCRLLKCHCIHATLADTIYSYYFRIVRMN